MSYVLVKFYKQPEPVMFGLDNVSHGPCLVTMDGVEWVSPIIVDGNAMECQTEHGGNFHHGITCNYIKAYRPIKTVEHAKMEASD